MVRSGLLVLVALLVLTSVLTPVTVSAQVVHLPTSDPQMKAAVASARRALPIFEAAFRDKRGSAYGVRIPIRDSRGAIENIWMEVDAIEGAVFVGRIGNTPANLPNLQLGSPYRASRAVVSDWSYNIGQTIHGGYTTRVTLKYLSKDQADILRAALAPLP